LEFHGLSVGYAQPNRPVSRRNGRSVAHLRLQSLIAGNIGRRSLGFQKKRWHRSLGSLIAGNIGRRSSGFQKKRWHRSLGSLLIGLIGLTFVCNRSLQ
jgi:hypothetical protein